jgi:serine/threonine protein kinase
MISPSTFPPSLVEHIGDVARVRCLSIRNGREVYLIEEQTGGFRVVKIYRDLTPSAVAAFSDVRSRIVEGIAEVHLMPIVAFGSDDSSAWEEFPLANNGSDDPPRFEDYSPLHPHRSNLDSKDSSNALAVEVGSAVCDALIALKSVGLIHGDVKPANVLRLGDRWVLADFDTVGSQSLSRPFTPSTEGYCPLGGDESEARDSYALGKLMYELWTGCDRLEYPTIPSWLMKSRWDRSDRLLNETICRLCSPLATQRLQDIGVVQRVLNALKHRGPSELDQAEALICSRQTKWTLPLVVAGMAGFAFAAGWYATSTKTEVWNGNPVVFCSYHNPDKINEGYARWTTDGVHRVWMLFNTHATLRQPLKESEELEFALKKEIWRGHVGLYVSEKPFYSFSEHWFISHREHFGQIDHLLFFHVDGDSLVAPTIFHGGGEVPFPARDWNVVATTNSLATYSVRLRVLPTEFRWNVWVGGLHLAEGRYARDPKKPAYLNVYTFDNTVCYLTQLTRNTIAPPQSER